MFLTNIYRDFFFQNFYLFSVVFADFFFFFLSVLVTTSKSNRRIFFSPSVLFR